MRLRNSGEVFGHFLIPATEEENTRKTLASAVVKATQSHATQPAMLSSIAGECDLLLHLYLDDFRVVSDLQAGVSSSHSLATSWLYAIAYEESNDLTPPSVSLEFFIYLRVHRHYYRRHGVKGERALLDAIRKILKRHGKSISARVLYSLGWPDLIIHGSLSEDIQHLRRLILSLQALSFATQSGLRKTKRPPKAPIFIKTITLLGIPIRLSERRGGHRMSAGMTLPAPVLLGRNRPGKTSQAIRAMEEAFGESGTTSVSSWAVDGTWDFVVTAPARESVSLERFYQVIRRRRRMLAQIGIERTQTHLLHSTGADLQQLKVRRTTLRPSGDDEPPSDHCECSRANFDTTRRRLDEAELRQQLPRGLARTISHALEMFEHTLRDESNCCDSAGALRAHMQGLQVLLNLALRARRFLDETPATQLDQQALIATEISYINSHLVEWCKRAGRVVREKTAGSSARLFLQIDSIVAQRGAIPKILMIAERLMRDFYEQLPPSIGNREAGAKRDFAAILEPLGNVTSQPLMGLVSIPIRYAFALHLVAPQLWHEVGQYVFWAEYSPSQRARIDLEIARAAVAPDMTPSRQKTESFAVDFHLRADMFADLLVFCFGFRGNLMDFFLYLSSLTANVAKHDNLHQQNWERQVVALIHRLLFIAQFLELHWRLKRFSGVTRQDFLDECKLVQGSLISPSEAAERSVRLIVAFLKDVDQDSGWPKQYQVPSTLIDTVTNNLTSKIYGRCLHDMAFLAYEFRNLSFQGKRVSLGNNVWSSIEAGELVDFESQEGLLTAYQEFYLEEVRAQLEGMGGPRRKEQFRKMASLGRSALLHIYHSEER